jgi:hypothetical protein
VHGANLLTINHRVPAHQIPGRHLIKQLTRTVHTANLLPIPIDHGRPGERDPLWHFVEHALREFQRRGPAQDGRATCWGLLAEDETHGGDSGSSPAAGGHEVPHKMGALPAGVFLQKMKLMAAAVDPLLLLEATRFGGWTTQGIPGRVAKCASRAQPNIAGAPACRTAHADLRRRLVASPTSSGLTRCSPCPHAAGDRAQGPRLAGARSRRASRGAVRGSCDGNRVWETSTSGWTRVRGRKENE